MCVYMCVSRPLRQCASTDRRLLGQNCACVSTRRFGPACCYIARAYILHSSSLGSTSFCASRRPSRTHFGRRLELELHSVCADNTYVNVRAKVFIVFVFTVCFWLLALHTKSLTR